MGSQISCQSRTRNYCGYGNPCNMEALGTADPPFPERRSITKSRTNRRANHHQTRETLLSDPEAEGSNAQALTRNRTLTLPVIEDAMFNKFEPAKLIIFGYIRLEAAPTVDRLFPAIPNSIHYLVCLYYFELESLFRCAEMELWNRRASLAEFSCSTNAQSLQRMWDKFDEHKRNLLATDKYLSKFIYTLFVLSIKSNRRGSVPPKYGQVKKATKYMSLLMIQSLPSEQKKYLSKSYFVSQFHVLWANIC